MSGPNLNSLPGLPHDDHGPVFAEPWQAQAFAMAIRLHEQGHFDWTEWASRLASVIDAAGPDDTDDYYLHWLRTLEGVVSDCGLASDAELADRENAWRRAAAATPHGEPIHLGADQAD